MSSNQPLGREERFRLLNRRGVTLWFTGLSGAGKTTIATRLERVLAEAGESVYRLDGDLLRDGLCADLGFSAADRDENIRRASELAALFADAGHITLASFISPYHAARMRCREAHERRNLPFLIVHVATSLEVCEARDPKGLYRRARAGQIRGFTGIDDPYEVPSSPDLTLDAGRQSLDECVEACLMALRRQGFQVARWKKAQ